MKFLSSQIFSRSTARLVCAKDGSSINDRWAWMKLLARARAWVDYEKTILLIRLKYNL